jgi:hypothetical protein
MKIEITIKESEKDREFHKKVKELFYSSNSRNEHIQLVLSGDFLFKYFDTNICSSELFTISMELHSVSNPPFIEMRSK